jgi:hypothetical protein
MVNPRLHQLTPVSPALTIIVRLYAAGLLCGRTLALWQPVIACIHHRAAVIGY